MNHFSRIKNILLFVTLTVCLVSFTACGGQQAQPEEQAKEVPKLQKKYKKLVVYPFTTTAELTKDYPEATTELMSSMMTALQMKGVFQSVEVAKKNQRTDRNTLVLKADITNLRIVSGAARFWGGVFAGSSGVDVNLTMIDGGTKKMLREEAMNSSNNAWGASYTGGSSDKSLLSDMGHIMAGYVTLSLP